ncbi:MAG: SagB/ThcOx family dehydrogenase [Candidatus Stahlbacteria bacterium]|nr:SagB/ThcOx family dehydrogenase [Candidatus Stahlbacteria bacterium]
MFLLLGGEGMEIKLPIPVLKGKVSIEECIGKRRSIRVYKDTPLTLEQISQLLWSLQGMTTANGLRCAPSAGATYPLEIRVVKADGVFHYIPEGHKLVREKTEDLRSKLTQSALGQSFIKEAPCDFIISAIYERTSKRYGERARRYIGHCAENLHLQAVAMGLASVPVGAFDDDEVKSILSLPQNEDPLYIIPVGYEK